VNSPKRNCQFNVREFAVASLKWRKKEVEIRVDMPTFCIVDVAKSIDGKNRLSKVYTCQTRTVCARFD
jgi:hypothetical protein